MKIELETTPEWAAMERKVANAEAMKASAEKKLDLVRATLRRVTERRNKLEKVLHVIYGEDEVADLVTYDEWLDELLDREGLM